MTVRLTPRQLTEPALESCRAAIRVKGECSNLTSYMRQGTPLLTCLWRYPERDAGKAETSLLFGRLAQALDADMVVMVSDAWVVSTKLPDGVTDLEDVLAGYDGPRPFEHPDRTEALHALAVTPAGGAWSWEQRYDRTDDGVTFGDVEEFVGLAQNGRIVASVAKGMRRDPRRPVPRASVVLAHLAGWFGPFPVYPLDPAVAELLERETR